MKKTIKSILGVTAGAAGAAYGIFRLFEGRSLTSYLLEKYLVRTEVKQAGFKENDRDVKQYFVHKAVLNDKPVENPAPIIKKKVTEKIIDGMQVFVWNDRKDPSQRVILYLHGGSYINQPSDLHYKAVEDVAKLTDAKVVFPVYPKVPKYNFKDAFPKIEKVYRKILENTASPELITVSGDSAGGGIALGLAVWLKDLKLPQPKDIVLLSPWLNIATQHPDIQDIYGKDPILSVSLTAEIAEKWADGTQNFHHPLVSPMYADITDLGRISIFIGTYDILYPSVNLFHEMLKNMGIEHNFIIGKKMVHDYSGLPIPEGKKARRQMAQIIKTEHRENKMKIPEDFFFGHDNLNEFLEV